MVVWSVATPNDRELIAAVVDRSLAVLAPAVVPFTANARNDPLPTIPVV